MPTNVWDSKALEALELCDGNIEQATKLMLQWMGANPEQEQAWWENGGRAIAARIVIDEVENDQPG